MIAFFFTMPIRRMIPIKAITFRSICMYTSDRSAPIPSAGVGALLALVYMQMDLNVIALIGIILLIGIVKKNAIMMIDFAILAERRDGLSPVNAIYQACL